MNLYPVRYVTGRGLSIRDYLQVSPIMPDSYPASALRRSWTMAVYRSCSPTATWDR